MFLRFSLSLPCHNTLVSVAVPVQYIMMHRCQMQEKSCAPYIDARDELCDLHPVSIGVARSSDLAMYYISRSLVGVREKGEKFTWVEKGTTPVDREIEGKGHETVTSHASPNWPAPDSALESLSFGTCTVTLTDLRLSPLSQTAVCTAELTTRRSTRGGDFLCSAGSPI